MSEPLIQCVVGTRPELIKMEPVIRALKDEGARVHCLHSGQHTDLARQAFSDMQLEPDEILNPERKDDRVGGLFAALHDSVRKALIQTRPDVVMVHGDTATAWAACMAAFYEGIPVAHVEAGLRCPTLNEPFPEEAHRRLIGRLANWHFAPTGQAARHLRSENAQGDILVTGNTAIDSIRERVLTWRNSPHQPSPALTSAWQAGTVSVPYSSAPFRLLLTAHRRENWGEPIRTLILELAQWLSQSDSHHIIWPLHANPALQDTIRSTVQQTVSAGLHPRLHLIQPLSYADTVWALQNCNALATDSGGLQEEASAFFKPVLVLRNSTERPEALDAGYAQLVGCGQGRLLPALQSIQNGQWPAAPADDDPRRWPFGDGHAAQRIARHLLRSLQPFTPDR